MIMWLALMIAVTSSPAFRARFLADSLVMIALSLSPPAISISTSAFTAPSVTFTTLPFSWLVALSFRPFSPLATMIEEALNR